MTTAAAAFVSGVTPTASTVAVAGTPGTTANSRASVLNGDATVLFSLKKLTPLPPATRMMNGPEYDPITGLAAPFASVVADPRTTPAGLIKLTVAPALNAPSAGTTVIVRVAGGRTGVDEPTSSPPPPPPHANKPTPTANVTVILDSHLSARFIVQPLQ